MSLVHARFELLNNGLTKAQVGETLGNLFKTNVISQTVCWPNHDSVGLVGMKFEVTAILCEGVNVIRRSPVISPPFFMAWSEVAKIVQSNARLANDYL